jgi:hypothetical protein
MLIYRWLPHGSKKLEDLQLLNTDFYKDWTTSMTTPMAIMHDQEPLDFDLWTKEDFSRSWENYVILKQRNHHYRDKDRVEFQVGLHLRGATNNGSNLYDCVIIAHSEQNSTEITKYKQHGYLPVYYWAHALIAADWFRYAQHDPVLEHNMANIKYDFLIYNRAWSGTREYRLTFVEMIANGNLAHQCLTTFSPVDNKQYYSEHQFKTATLQIKHNRLHEIFNLNQHLSSASADYNNLDYSQSGIEVVLETLFDDTRWHLTEKTLRPIACAKPFMLAATPGSLQYLRSYGFETFGEYINEDYDLITDPRQRLDALVKEMSRISQLPAEQKRTLWQQLNHIAKRNQQRFFSFEWQSSIEQEFYQNLDEAMIEMQRHCTGKYWKQSKTMPKSVKATAQELQFFEDWIRERNQDLTRDPSQDSSGGDCL